MKTLFILGFILVIGLSFAEEFEDEEDTQLEDPYNLTPYGRSGYHHKPKFTYVTKCKKTGYVKKCRKTWQCIPKYYYRTQCNKIPKCKFILPN